MASLHMTGPFPYTRESINKYVPEGKPGNYALGTLDEENNTFIVEYVGRADKNLKERIGHSLKEYSHFKFSIASSPREAYYKECQNWHDFGGKEGKLHNDIHPDRPDGDEAAQCPICTPKR